MATSMGESFSSCATSAAPPRIVTYDLKFVENVCHSSRLLESHDGGEILIDPRSIVFVRSQFCGLLAEALSVVCRDSD